MTKKIWRKPEVKTLRAGAAETGNNSQVSDANSPSGQTKS